MNNILLRARWRDGKQGRGFWMCGCMTCPQVLAEVKLGYREKSRMCGGGLRPRVALVLPLGVDLREGKRSHNWENFPSFEPGSYFAKTKRSAAKLTHGRAERGMFSAHLEISTHWVPGVKVRDREIINQGAAEYARQNLKEIREQKTPEQPTFVTPDALPIVILCPRDGCKRISIIHLMAGGAMMERIERNIQKEASLNEQGIFLTPTFE